MNSAPQNPLLFFWMLLKASLFSSGGMGNLPLLHDDFITATHWATDRQFAEALAIAQITPGPNGLWVVSLGYLMHGIGGALLTLLAICLPPLLVLPIAHLHKRLGENPAVAGFVHGLGSAVVGIFAVVLLKLLRQSGIDRNSLMIAFAAFVLGNLRRVPILVVIGLGAVAGILLR